MFRKVLSALTAAVTVLLFIAPICADSAYTPKVSVSYSSDENSVTLSWDAGGESIVKSIVYKYDEGKKKFMTVSKTKETSYTQSGMKPGEKAVYQISARLKSGKSVRSDPVTVYSALEIIPMHDSDLRSCGSKRALCYLRDERMLGKEEWEGGRFKLIYRNFKGEKLLYESDDCFNYSAAVSADGSVAYYSVDSTVCAYFYHTDRCIKIYDIKTYGLPHIERCRLYSSENGEYCLIYWLYFAPDAESRFEHTDHLTIWHNGETVTSEIPYSADICGISDGGTAVYMDDSGRNTELYSFSFGSGTADRFAEVGGSLYRMDVCFENNRYILYDDRKIYSGKVGSAPKLVFSGRLDGSFIDAYDGCCAVVYDNGYAVRVNLENGKKATLAKIKGDINSRYFVCTEDMKTAVYLDNGNNKLVRLSGWSEKKDAYTKRQEIPLNGTGLEFIDEYSEDLSVINIWCGEKTEDGYGGCLAYFDSGSLVSADNVWSIDRFNHVLCRDEEGGWYILNPDGSSKKVLSRQYEYFRYDEKSGFFILGKQKPLFFDSDGWDTGGTYTEYYIDENGKAVFLWVGRSEYEILYEPESE